MGTTVRFDENYIEPACGRMGQWGGFFFFIFRGTVDRCIHWRINDSPARSGNLHNDTPFLHQAVNCNGLELVTERWESCLVAHDFSRLDHCWKQTKYFTARRCTVTTVVEHPGQISPHSPAHPPRISDKLQHARRLLRPTHPQISDKL